jgi:hypothetical protein
VVLGGIVTALASGAGTAADAVQETNGRNVADADKAWAGRYETAAEAGQACPDPDASLALRATDRTVSPRQGLALSGIRQCATSKGLRERLRCLS